MCPTIFSQRPKATAYRPEPEFYILSRESRSKKIEIQKNRDPKIEIQKNQDSKIQFQNSTI